MQSPAATVLDQYADDEETDDDDEDWLPPTRRKKAPRPWHTAETAGRIGQVVALRIQHGYRRPPGPTIEALLAGHGASWRAGLAAEAMPTGVQLRDALLGWPSPPPVPVAAGFDYDSTEGW